MTSLKRTQDRKTTALAKTTKGGSRSVVANAFSLPAGTEYSCPGATLACEAVCYAGRLEKAYPNFRKSVLHNWGLLKDADYVTMRTLLFQMMDEFIKDSDKYGSRRVFRIHADGDFFNDTYALAWRSVMHNTPDIMYWAYTRSFRPPLNVVPILAHIPNLSLYISVDADNAQFVSAALEAYPQVRVATLAQTASEAKQMLPERTIISCPENIKRIPLVVKDKGACVACSLCIRGKHDVAFSIGKREQ